MRWHLFTLLLLFVPILGNAQDVGVPLALQSIKGQPSTIEYERVYVRYRGQNVGEKYERVAFGRYDRDGRTLEDIAYGNGRSQTLYNYENGNLVAEVAYFDSAGNRMDEAKFRSNVDSPVESGLCAQYSVKSEDDEIAKIERTREVCRDGSTRAETVNEFDQADNLVRSVRTDALSRRWEEVLEYDAKGNIREYRITVTADSKPAYTQTVRCSDHKYDDHGNWIRFTATAFISTRPDSLWYQYNEHRKITYHPEVKNERK